MGARGRLLKRRERLVALSGAQRSALGAAAAPVASRLAAIDRVTRALRAHPALAAFAGGMLLAWGRKRLLGWGLSLARRLV